MKILSYDQLFRESKRSPETKVRKVVTHLGCLLMPISELGRQRQEQHTFWATLACTVRPCLRTQKQSCYLLEVRSSLKTLCLMSAGDTHKQAVALVYGKCCVISTGCFVPSEWCPWDRSTGKDKNGLQENRFHES